MVTIPKLGQVRGSKMVSVAGKMFYAFRGIPYAQPPVGDLRFRDPVAADPWFGKIFDASREGPTCMQYHGNLRLILGVEDCLTLNVYTRKLDFTNSGKPVLVWIPGGAWYKGSGNGVANAWGPGYFMDRDVVFVTMNYRLGPLGFLSTEDSEAPGNYGLLDQTMALRWIRDNIRSFGGDPDSVTIFGCSAGAASVHYHILSPHSKGLFHRAILQSGSSLNSWAIGKSVGSYTQQLGQYFNCPQSNSSALLTCLRKAPARKMAGFRRQIQIMLEYPIAFGPRIDIERKSPFLPGHPRELMESKQFNSVPVISGLNKNEGALVILMLLSNNGELLRRFNKDPVKYLRLVVNSDDIDDDIVKQISDRYFALDKPFHPNQISKLAEIFSDYAFFQDLDESVELFSKYNDEATYYYMYNHTSQFTLQRFLGVSSSLDLSGSHVDEVFLMFSHLILPRLRSSKDIKVSNMLLDLWTTFAKDGIPRSSLLPQDWIPTKEEQPRYLRIEAEHPALVNESMPFYQRIQYWKHKLRR
ncbi:venom carboxylesterase-6-like isoform X1 [Daphnia pulex]|uniref:venom carboxylesterase-6-like isoform X1 n=1 Tax=Daphnia pulex TaxID=6669 RepID=UPI001EE02486|nr:venom carboxylesterase-6-like isoform X1 [Daphnia pulex]